MCGVVVPVSPATYAPVTVARAKERLRIDFGDDDADLEALIHAAVKAVEDGTGRTLAAAGYQLQLPAWPAVIGIPAYPVRSVTAIAYLDDSEVLQTLPAGQWYWLPTDAGADVRFRDTFGAPSLADRPDAVRVAFEAGYDDPAAPPSPPDPRLALDPRLELAVLAHVGAAYENREAVVVGQSPADMAPVFKALVQQLRIWRP